MWGEQTMVTSTLKPCPFCGSLATYVYGDRGWIAGCTNKDCLVYYNVLHDGYDGFSLDINMAKRIWNRRAHEDAEQS